MGLLTDGLGYRWLGKGLAIFFFLGEVAYFQILTVYLFQLLFTFCIDESSARTILDPTMVQYLPLVLDFHVIPFTLSLASLCPHLLCPWIWCFIISPFLLNKSPHLGLGKSSQSPVWVAWGGGPGRSLLL